MTTTHGKVQWKSKFDERYIDAPGRSVFIRDNVHPARIDEKQGIEIQSFIQSTLLELVKAIVEKKYMTADIVDISDILLVAKEQFGVDL